MREDSFNIVGMTCQSCVKSITNALSNSPGVVSVLVTLDTHSGIVSYDPSLLDSVDIIGLIEDCGFDASLKDISKPEQFIALSSSVSNETASFKNTLSNTLSANTPSSLSSSSSNTLSGNNISSSNTLLTNTLTNSHDTTGQPPLSNPLSANPTSSMKDTSTASFAIRGMTCASCVNNIERHVKKLPGIVSIRVTLLAEKGEVVYNSTSDLTPESIAKEIVKLGFKASIIPTHHDNTIIKLKLFGLKTSDHVVTLERELKKLKGVFSVDIDLMSEKALIHVDPKITGVRHMVEAIEKCGFNALTDVSGSHAQLESLKRTKEIHELRKSFFRSLMFAVPVSFLSMVFPLFTPTYKFIHYQPLPGLHLGDLFQMILTIPVQFIIGQRFYTSALASLRHGVATMDVLVALGTTIAFIFSIFVVLSGIGSTSSSSSSSSSIEGTPTFFETSSTLITVVLFGRLLENIAKGKTSSALSKLMTLTPASATLIETIELSTSTNSNSDPEKLSPTTKETTTISKEIRKEIISEKTVITRDRKIPTDLIQASDLLRIHPGEKIPVDGIVISGNSLVDESLITGESIPLIKKIGSSLIGGTVNGSGSFIMKATRVGQDTALSQIVRLVEEAQNSKPPIQDLADKIAGYFVPGVVGLGFLTFVIWMILLKCTEIGPHFILSHGKNNNNMGEGNDDILFWCIKTSIAVIVVACPCALGLATPTAVMVGTGVGASMGILIKSGTGLEGGGKIDRIIFDKTGTLTKGGLAVEKVKRIRMTKENMNGSNNDNEIHDHILWHGIGSIEKNSEHPIGKSLVEYAKTILQGENKGKGERQGKEGNDKETHIQFKDSTQFENVAGFGVKGIVDQHIFIVGNELWMKDCGISITGNGIQDTVMEWMSNGWTVIYVAVNHQLEAIIGLNDTIRPEAPMTITALKQMGISVSMVTGDQRATAEVVAKQCGITDIHAGVSPGGKREIVETMKQSGAIVGMVGDGMNDSVALSAADMGIAVSSGTDIAISSANVVLMRPNLMDVAIALDLSRTIVRRIRLNFIFACIYNVIMIPVAAGCFVGLGITLHPMAAGMAMSLSSASVVGSSLLLKRYKPKLFGLIPMHEISTSNSSPSSLPSSSLFPSTSLNEFMKQQLPQYHQDRRISDYSMYEMEESPSIYHHPSLSLPQLGRGRNPYLKLSGQSDEEEEYDDFV